MLFFIINLFPDFKLKITFLVFYFGFISSKLKQHYSWSSKQAIVHKILSVSPETEKEQISFFLNPV